MSLDRQQDIHENAVAKGFWPAPNGPGTVDVNFILSKMCLLHSEVSEMMEAVRKRQGSDAIMAEAADIVIRLEDLIEGMYDHGWIDIHDLDLAVDYKMAHNTTRPRLHGNLV